MHTQTKSTQSTKKKGKSLEEILQENIDFVTELHGELSRYTIRGKVPVKGEDKQRLDLAVSKLAESLKAMNDLARSLKDGSN